MPLRFDLGPFEELHIGRCMITNSHDRSMFAVEGDMPILRGKEYLPETAARSPLEKLYHCIQQMYLEEAYDKYQGRYLQLAAECLRNDPTLSAELEAGDQLIRAGDFYRVLKSLKKLIPVDAFQADNLGPSKVLRSANYVARVNGWKQRR
jgi:flagellar biosynthesis repressor protein FlbT